MCSIQKMNRKTSVLLRVSGHSSENLMSLRQVQNSLQTCTVWLRSNISNTKVKANDSRKNFSFFGTDLHKKTANPQNHLKSSSRLLGNKSERISHLRSASRKAKATHLRGKKDSCSVLEWVKTGHPHLFWGGRLVWRLNEQHIHCETCMCANEYIGQMAA